MKRKRVVTSISAVLAGTLGFVGDMQSAYAVTMYNTFITANPTDTDGWTHTGGIGNTGGLQPWVGVANQPFGYSGTSHLNWAAQITSPGDSMTVSSADAQARYGFTAEIDTGAGAWQDTGVDGSGNPTANGPTGWKHQTDIGLIKSDVTQNVTLNLRTLGGINDNFGVTVFTGIDSNTGSYNHHGSWNCPGCTPPKSFTADNPFGTQGLTYLAHDATVDATNGLTFTAEAGQVYSIYLGGAGVGRWNNNIAGYELNIASAPVPVPAAIWLFGSALAGLAGARRRSY